MNIDEAQANMRHAYFGGATGIFASSLVWLAAALVSHLVSPRGGIAALFIGGMLIHPAAIRVFETARPPRRARKDNPLGRLAIETTVWMLLAIPVASCSRSSVPSGSSSRCCSPSAVATSRSRRYTDLRVYWICGIALAFAAFGLAALNAGSTVAALTGAVIELIFAAIVYASSRRETGTAPDGQRTSDSEITPETPPRHHYPRPI